MSHGSARLPGREPGRGTDRNAGRAISVPGPSAMAAEGPLYRLLAVPKAVNEAPGGGTRGEPYFGQPRGPVPRRAAAPVLRPPPGRGRVPGGPAGARPRRARLL